MNDTGFVCRFEGFRDLLGDGQASSMGIGPFEIRSARVGPSTSSSTSARVPSDSSMP